MDRHKELKDHIRAKQIRNRNKMLWMERKGKREPVDGVEASRVAAEYLELKPAKVTRL